VADMDHERAAADRGAVDPLRGEAEMDERHRSTGAVRILLLSEPFHTAALLRLLTSRFVGEEGERWAQNSSRVSTLYIGRAEDRLSEHPQLG
jgi:hypothetical protein